MRGNMRQDTRQGQIIREMYRMEYNLRHLTKYLVAQL